MRFNKYGIDISEDKVYEYGSEGVFNLEKEFGVLSGNALNDAIEIALNSESNVRGAPSIQQDIFKQSIQKSIPGQNGAALVLSSTQTHSLVYDGNDDVKIKISSTGVLSLSIDTKSQISNSSSVETYLISESDYTINRSQSLGTAGGMGAKFDLLAGLPDPRRPADIQNNIQFSVKASNKIENGVPESALVLTTQVRLNGYLHTEEIKLKVGTGDNDSLSRSVQTIYDKLSGALSQSASIPVDMQAITSLLNVSGMDENVSEQIKASAVEFMRALAQQNNLKNSVFGIVQA